jgi:hypothetical protein
MTILIVRDASCDTVAAVSLPKEASFLFLLAVLLGHYIGQFLDRH